MAVKLPTNQIKLLSITLLPYCIAGNILRGTKFCEFVVTVKIANINSRKIKFSAQNVVLCMHSDAAS